MVVRDCGYVAATFVERDIEPFQKLTELVCSESDFYHSDTIDYINGNVSSDLHLTVFYGLIDENLDRGKLDSYIGDTKLTALALGELELRWEYSGLCQILWIQVLDQDHELEKIFEDFKKFEHEESVQLEFIPHLTLAYVKPEYRLVNSISDYPREIKVEDVKYLRNSK